MQLDCITSDPVMQQHVIHRAFDLEMDQYPAHIYFIPIWLVEWMKPFFEVAEQF